MENTNTKFNKNMNTLRGLGILLVIMGHAIFKDLINVKYIKNVNFLFGYMILFIRSIYHSSLFISRFFARKIFII